MDATVAAEHAAVLVDDRAAAIPGRALRDERRIVVVGDETDFLAVRLLGDRQAAPPRVLAHRVLRPIADGEDRAGELLLGQREQKVRLIPGRIGAAPQAMPSALPVALDARVVAGRDRVGAEAARPL